jgi:two-component system sensor histidine kinase UhpB
VIASPSRKGNSSRLPWALLGMAALYAIGWACLWSISHALWFLPAGLRLGALWLTPTRRWAWLAAGEWTAAVALTLMGGWSAFDAVFLLTSVLPWLIYAAAVRLIRGPNHETLVGDPRRMLLLLSSGLLSAALVSPLLQQFLHGVGPGRVGLAGVFTFIYGDFLGQLVVAPLLVMALRDDWRKSLNYSLCMDVGLQILFSLTVFWLIRQRHDLAPFVLLLAFAPIFFVAFRQGWQGAAISVTLVGLLIEGMLELGMLPVDMRVLQLALAVVGSGGLVLGAASSELRRSHERLALRHRELGIMNRSLNDAAVELRNVSQRLVRLEEQGQRELAGELDYELGQSIHALSTRISLAFRDVRDEQVLRLLESVREQVREMQDSLRRVLRQLRPQALDTHGLREAVGFGPLREMLEDAGIAFETAFYGRIEALSEDVQTTIYRICQAAVRDASQSPSIRRLLVRIDVMPGEERRTVVLIQIDIEASPFLDFPIEPVPLAVITDRVMAQQGSYWVEALAPGVRHRIRFEEDAASLL